MAAIIKLTTVGGNEFSVRVEKNSALIAPSDRKTVKYKMEYIIVIGEGRR